MVVWKKLKSKKDLKMALQRVEELMNAKRTHEIINELTLLSYLIEEYEKIHFAIEDAHPHEVIAFAMEMKGLKQKDLIPLLGSKGQVSKIMNGSRNLQLHQVSQLSEFLGIPAEALIPRLTEKENEAFAVADQKEVYKAKPGKR